MNKAINRSAALGIAVDPRDPRQGLQEAAARLREALAQVSDPTELGRVSVALATVYTAMSRLAADEVKLNASRPAEDFSGLSDDELEAKREELLAQLGDETH